MAVLVSPQVKSELDDIWTYIASESASSEVADRVIDGITATFRQLSNIRILAAAVMTCAMACEV